MGINCFQLQLGQLYLYNSHVRMFAKIISHKCVLLIFSHLISLFQFNNDFIEMVI